jgi:hypothetical protein
MKKRQPVPWLGRAVLLGVIGTAVLASGWLYASERLARAKVAGVEHYPYRTPRFTQFLAESYQEARAGDPRAFYTWWESAYRTSPVRYPGKEGLELPALLEDRRLFLAAIPDPHARAKAERELGGWLHRLIKKAIPRFSLDRGFEFTNTVRYGERQCFLQAVLIASLLQRMGVDAGVAMVYRNLHGQETNNGHAVTLVKLASGRDLIVDASDPEPFVRQQGLLVRAPQQRYVAPVYEAGTNEILHYLAAADRSKLPTATVRDLDYNFIRSQFWYYRGERASGGILARRPTVEGLEASARALRTSTRLCGQNALALYMLGRVYLAQGRAAESRTLFESAGKLYAACGWVPSGPRQYLARASRR